jgi:hypothetical protein
VGPSAYVWTDLSEVWIGESTALIVRGRKTLDANRPLRSGILPPNDPNHSDEENLPMRARRSHPSSQAEPQAPGVSLLVSRMQMPELCFDEEEIDGSVLT